MAGRDDQNRQAASVSVLRGGHGRERQEQAGASNAVQGRAEHGNEGCQVV